MNRDERKVKEFEEDISNEDKEKFDMFLKFKIRWTICWMIFILLLCAIFNNGWSLFLLIIMLAGIL